VAVYNVFITQFQVEADDPEEASEKFAELLMTPESEKWIVVERANDNTFDIQEYACAIPNIQIGPRRRT
jgi:hypothetical protein